jgi:hypothetical protein
VAAHGSHSARVVKLREILAAADHPSHATIDHHHRSVRPEAR